MKPPSAEVSIRRCLWQVFHAAITQPSHQNHVANAPGLPCFTGAGFALRPADPRRCVPDDLGGARLGSNVRFRFGGCDGWSCQESVVRGERRRARADTAPQVLWTPDPFRNGPSQWRRSVGRRDRARPALPELMSGRDVMPRTANPGPSDRTADDVPPRERPGPRGRAGASRRSTRTL